MKIIRNILVIIGIVALVLVIGAPGAADAGNISTERCFVQMLLGTAVFAITMKAVRAI